MDSNKNTNFSTDFPQDSQTNQFAEQSNRTALQDLKLQENIARFVREKTPERGLFAKGTGAYGTFTVTGDIIGSTRAKLFSKPGNSCRIFTRFSLSNAEKGSSDTERDICGFAVKFYTEDGIWDLVGNNSPVFFVKEAQKFPELIKIQKRNSKTNLKDHNAMWEFWASNPESLHQLMILMSDRGTPHGYRHMHGFGAHTFSMINENNEKVWVKFHLKTKQGIKNFSAEEIGASPDFAHEDFLKAISDGNFPKWTMYIQIMTQDEAKDFRWNPFDVTKVWPHDDFPLVEVGELELNEIPENYFSEVEQAAFSPGNLIDGISLSPDPLLQSRLFSYTDAQRYRIGAHADQLKVNRCPFSTDPDLNLSYKNSAEFNDNHYDPSLYQTENHNDHYTQPGLLYTKAMNEQDRENLVNTIVKEMDKIDGPRRNEIINRQLCHFFRANLELGMKIALGLKINIDTNMFSHTKS